MYLACRVSHHGFREEGGDAPDTSPWTFVQRPAPRVQEGKLEMGKHDEKKQADGKWDKPVPPMDPKNPPGGGKHEKGK